jgi:hypothetical protein
MGITMTRRQLALLLAQGLISAPILAADNKLRNSNTVQDAVEELTHHDEQPVAPVYIVVWLDTEDYILPASDDAAKRIAEFLTGQGIHATFKVVGEKARVLEQRQRTDVIAALSRQEIGYHSNTHSQQPTVAQYESVLDWETGAEEFDRRERAGFDDVTRIFGKSPTCYGQPGYSWAPQVYPTLKKWGVNVYLDDGEQVELGGKPFWYGGLLNIFNIHAGQQLEPNNEWSNLANAKAEFKALYAQMSSQRPGGLISIYFHPTEFVSKEFWDAVNFGHGANPPRSEWKHQPEKSPEERELAFQYFEGLMSYMKSFPGARFVTASEALGLYRDSAQGRAFNTQDLAEVAGQVNTNITFQIHDYYVLSASETFTLLNSFVASFTGRRTNEAIKLNGTPYGPSSPAYGVAIPQEKLEIAWSQFSRTSIDVEAFLKTNQAIPNAVWFGSTAVTPESYLLALANVTKALILKGKPPDSVSILPAELAASQCVAKDSPALWPWPIFPPGFHSSHVIDLARLQAWTIKPAVLESIG